MTDGVLTIVVSFVLGVFLKYPLFSDIYEAWVYSSGRVAIIVMIFTVAMRYEN